MSCAKLAVCKAALDYLWRLDQDDYLRLNAGADGSCLRYLSFSEFAPAFTFGIENLVRLVEIPG